MVEWAMFRGDSDYAVVAQTRLPNDGVVSTVWLGIPALSFSAKPLIFETMVFSAEGEVIERERYATEEQAFEGHKFLTAKHAGFPR